jgi:hypothetical protein
MKKTLPLAALAALTLALPAAAQERRPVGLGVSIAPFAQAVQLSPAVEVYVPIAIAPQFRLEPSLGIWTNDEDAGLESKDVTLGLGAFFVKQVAPPADMYAGARLKLNFASVDNGVVSDSDTDFVLAAALGGEYYFVPQLSLGLEAQLGLYQRGDVSGNDSGFFTNGLAFLRFYF